MSHQQSPWSLRIPCLSRNLSVQEVEKIKSFGLNAWTKVKRIKEQYTPVAVGAAVTVAIVAGAGAVKALEVVANASADVHDALVHKLSVMDAVYRKETAALFNEPQDSEGQVLVMHAYVDDKNEDSIGQ